MKIQSLTGNWGYYGVVREKQDGGSGNQQRSPDGQGRQSKDHKDEYSNSNFEEQAPSQEKMDEAIKAFGRDTQAQESGISASLEGSGPGLKVVLKDGAGKVVRQLTGYEFIQLRSSTPTEGHSCGKILDRKL